MLNPLINYLTTMSWEIIIVDKALITYRGSIISTAI
jgi:hypothetical protein